MREEDATFRNPMDADSIQQRLLVCGNINPAYDLAWRAAGHESLFTVDCLAYKLRHDRRLADLIAELAVEVEAENLRRVGGAW